MEKWLPIAGFEKQYVVSDHGRVRRTSGKTAGLILSPSMNRGYPRLTLKNKGRLAYRYVHRLVAEAFLGEPPNSRMQVNHKDGNRQHAHVTNLEWILPIENMRHAVRTGLHRSPGPINPRRGTGVVTSKLAEATVREIRALRGTATCDELGARFGVSRALISLVQLRRIWAHVPD